MKLSVLVVLLIFTISMVSAITVDEEVMDQMSTSDQVKVIAIYKDTPDFVPADANSFENLDGFTGEIGIKDMNKMMRDPNLVSVQIDWKLKQLRFDSEEIMNFTGAHAVNLSGVNLTGINQTICLIDSGLDYTHDEFGNCTFGEYQNGTCYGGKVIPGYDFVNGDNDPMDDNFHGTFIAGIIKTMAPDAKIIPMKACDQAGDCYASAIINAIDYCMSNRTQYNINVISLSIGDQAEHSDSNCFPTDAMALAINDAYDAGVFVSVASGNDGFTGGLNYPACVRGATSVGATTKADQIAAFTNTYSTLDLLATGAVINSTGLNDSVGISSGTSFSCPMVSAAAVLLQQYGNGTYSPICIENKLKNSGVLINTSGRSQVWPRIDVLSSLSTGCECAQDEDCGQSGYIGTQLCSSNNLWKSYQNFTCNKGYCSNVTTPTIYQVCGTGCVANTTTCRSSGGGSGGANLRSCQIEVNSQWQTNSPITLTVKVYDSNNGLFSDIDEVAFTLYDIANNPVYRTTLPTANPSVGVYEFEYIPDKEFLGNFSAECYARRNTIEVINYKPVEIVEIGGLRTVTGGINLENQGALVKVDSIMLGAKSIFLTIIDQFRNVINGILGIKQ